MSTESVPVPPVANPKPLASPIAAPPTKQPLPPQAVKLQIHDKNVRPYRPKLAPKKRIAAEPKRRCFSCCCCVFWFVVVLGVLAVVMAAACGVFWFLYRPHRPRFIVASLQLGNLNLTGNLDTDAAGHLITSGNLTISAKNPNSKITAFYDEVAMSAFSPRNVMIANSTFRPFASPPGNSTVIRFVFSNSRTLDLESAKGLRSDLAGRSEIASRLELETKMGVKIGKWKTRKIGIRVICVGVRVKVPFPAATKKNNSATAADSDHGNCKVDLSNSIWGFTF